MKFALISDIHGNIAALEAVIESINGKGIKSVYNLGDSIYGPLWPNETAEYLRNSGIKTIIGNGDYDILNYPTKNKTLEINSNKLSDINKEWIRNLPHYLVERDIKIFHGTINSMYEYFIEYIENGSVKIRENDYLEDQIRAIKTKYVGFGHSHIERVLKVNNQILLNPGSVGLPAYSDDEPKHKMETLNNKAKYIEVDNDEIVIHYIEYDYMRAVKEARKNKRDDWAYSIETGRAL